MEIQYNSIQVIKKRLAFDILKNFLGLQAVNLIILNILLKGFVKSLPIQNTIF